MIIINSGAYVIAEFQAEMGRIPPCMLPIGNKKLIENQVQEIRKNHPDEQIYVTLPESYILTVNENRLLSELSVTPIAANDEFTLAESILFALNTSDTDDQEVIRLIHGDTLIINLPHPSRANFLGVAYSADDYNWQTEPTDDGRDLVWCGFFSFDRRKDLIQSLALSRGNFVKAVQTYRQRHYMDLLLLENWHDLGHVNTYFRSRAAITTQRAFNTLQVVQGVVYKTGEPDIKIQAEGSWFENLPVYLKKFAPQLIDRGVSHNNQSYYKLEYLPIMPLNELFVHGRNSANEWRKLFELAGQFLQLCTNSSISPETQALISKDFDLLIADKTRHRLNTYSSQTGLDLNRPVYYAGQALPSVFEIAEECIKKSRLLPASPAIMHGDFCFSNILFDSRADQIKVIDPRGITTTNELTLYGDQKYDLAKLAHSVIGLYDFIIAGRYKIFVHHQYHLELDFELDERICEIQTIFRNHQFGGNLTIAQIIPLVVLLFLSMLPLHQDRPDRQQAMLANALRLFSQTTHKTR